jgi:colanic acid/amylovoran biosynthesis protein
LLRYWAVVSTSPVCIALVNAWHDDNRGDSAIAEATIGLIRRKWPGAAVTVVSLLDSEHPEFHRAYRHLRRQSGDPVIVGNAMPHLDRSGGLTGMAAKTIRFAVRLPGAIIALAQPARTRRPAFVAIRKADLVVVNGGASIYSHRHSVLAWVNLFRVLLPVMYAVRAQRPVLFLGHSLGPFPDRVSRRMTSSVLRRADRVVVREESSGELAVALGVPRDRLDVVPDIAFALEPRPTSRVDALLDAHGLETGKFWVVTVRQVYETAQREERTRRFLDEMASFVEQTLTAGDTDKVVLFAHTIGPVANEDDRPITRRLNALLDDARVVVVDDDLDAGEIAAFYGHAALLIGTRLHSVILALVAGTPAVAIAYFGTKAQGTMRLVGAEQLCIGIDEVTGAVLLALIEQEDPTADRAETFARVQSLKLDVERTLDTFEIGPHRRTDIAR